MGSVDGAPGRALEWVTGDLEQAAGRAERLGLGSLDALRRRSVEAGRAAAGRQAWGKGSATSSRGGERWAREGPRKADGPPPARPLHPPAPPPCTPPAPPGSPTSGLPGAGPRKDSRHDRPMTVR